MIALPILLPLAFAILALVMRQAARAAGVLGAFATVTACVGLAAQVWSAGTQRETIGGWDVPLGIALHADGLAMAMLLLTGMAGAVISVYAAIYLRDEEKGRGSAPTFWPVWLLLWSALNGVYLASDMFNVYVLLEATGIAAVALLVQAGNRAAYVAGMRYFLAALVGSLAYLLGVALLYGAHGTLDIHALRGLVSDDHGALIALALISAGLIMKTALFPLHFWLPPAHSAASTPVSALLSALVIKASFYLFVRLWFETFDAVRGPGAAQLLGSLGAMAILWGSYQAIRQRRLKLLIAHSTVAQIGYFFLLFPLTVTTAGVVQPWMVEAWNGGIYQVISHGFAKASLFLSAGIILRAIGSDDLHALRDIAGRMPVTTFALAIAGASLIGLPPTGGFVAKWMLLYAVISSGQWWWLPVIVVGGLLTAGYVFSMLRFTFTAADNALPFKPVSPTLEYCALTLALIAAALGMRLEEPLALLAIGSPFRQFEAGVP
jgi:multicomponent Na+:H+ antiporter subunit D